MIGHRPARWWAEGVLFALGSVLLAQTGLGVFLFLIPIQMAATRQGKAVLGLSASLAGASITAVAVVTAALRGRLPEAWGVILVEAAAALLLILGLAVASLLDGRPFTREPLRTVPRLLVATGLSGILSVPLALAMGPSSPLGGSVERFFRENAQGMATLFSAGTGSFASGLDVAALAAQIEHVMLAILPRCYLLYYFVILTFSMWAGRLAGAASLRQRVERTRLRGFFLPAGYVWPLIGSLAIILADLALDVGPAAYPGWNAGLVMAFLFGLQGLGIVQFAFERYSVPRTFRVIVYAVLTVMVLTPAANLVVLIGLPALGVSETWLSYRTRRRTTDEGDP